MENALIIFQIRFHLILSIGNSNVGCALRTILFSKGIVLIKSDSFPPIFGIKSFSDKTMKAGMGPIPNAFYQSMFRRVKMNIIDMPAIVRIIPYAMLPKTSLPDGCFAASNPGRIGRLLPVKNCFARFGKLGLNQSPAF
jgi:hypothetical protein